jgi:hypothetical protein
LVLLAFADRIVDLCRPLDNKCLEFVPFSQHPTRTCCRDCQPSRPFIAAVASVRVFLSGSGEFRPTTIQEISMLKLAIVGLASLALVGTAVAADLPRPQPQPVAAPVGKYPMGKYPVGKSPVGKYPVAAPAPLVTKG